MYYAINLNLNFIKRIKKMKTIVPLIFIILLFTGCDDDSLDSDKKSDSKDTAFAENDDNKDSNDSTTRQDYEGIRTGCNYSTDSGISRIISIEDPPPNHNNCYVDPKLVVLEFIPSEGESNPMDSGWYFTVGDGKNPPLSCLEPSGMFVGAEFESTRLIITSGACTPVIYRIKTGELCTTTCLQR
jgi:hypothetical protein